MAISDNNDGLVGAGFACPKNEGESTVQRSLKEIASQARNDEKEDAMTGTVNFEF